MDKFKAGLRGYGAANGLAYAPGRVRDADVAQQQGRMLDPPYLVSAIERQGFPITGFSGNIAGNSGYTWIRDDPYP